MQAITQITYPGEMEDWVDWVVSADNFLEGLLKTVDNNDMHH